MAIQSNKEKKRVVIIELGPTTLMWLMQIPLVCLKLTEAITIPWWLVLLPVWGVFLLAVVVSLVLGIIWIVQNTFYFSKR